jgi:hypothetical protein
MLVISKEQLETIKAVQLSQFKKKLYIEIKQRLSSDDLFNISDTELRTRIEYAIDSASDYDLIEEKNVIRYAFLVAILGTYFHKKSINDWMVSILKSPITASNRLDQLTQVIQSS